MLDRLWIAAMLIGLPLVYFFPAIINNLTLVPGDGLSQNLGVRVLIGQMIRSGQLPLWNPYIFAGTPLLASVYPGAIYPPNWIFALFAPATAMNIVVITTYHLTLIGAYLYARRIGMTRVGALITGTAFSFGGYMIAHLGHTSRIAAGAWLPWILLAIEHLYIRVTWRWIVLGSLFIALQLFAGEPQMNFYTILVCGAYLLFSLLRREVRESRIRLVLGMAAMCVCGFLLSMIQLLPERELLSLGERSNIKYETFSGYSFPPAQIFTFISPFFFGGGAMSPFKITYWGGQTMDETCGYFGVLTLLLGLVALFGSSRSSLARFWGIIALVSFVLSFGGFLPFGLNHILHQTPVYNLFRASGRHLYEFTFSVAVLAGLGTSLIAQNDREKINRILQRGVITFIAAVAVTLVAYRFFGGRLAVDTPPPQGAESLLNPEALFPLGIAVLSLITFLVYARWRNGIGAVMLIVVIFADLLFFGVAFNWGWRDFVRNTSARLLDPPAVRFIKSREPDLNVFRTVTAGPRPYGVNYFALNSPNISIARGLQSVNGYDALHLLRQSAISGDMGMDGLVGDPSIFLLGHQGLNLLNVKYMLCERNSAADPINNITIGEISFRKDLLDLDLSPGKHAEAVLGGVMASELAIVSLMGHSVHIPDNTPAARIRLHTKDGQIVEREIWAGRDTAEWAYDRQDVKVNIKHRLPRIAESWPVEGFEGHNFLTEFRFDRALIDRIEWDYLLPDASVLVQRVSLIDNATGISRSLDMTDFLHGRWQRLERFDDVEVYENIKHMPRAWFVRRAQVESSADVLEIIKTGKMKDGSRFDPAETALFEKEDLGNRSIVLPPISNPGVSEVKITRYEPNRIELQTRNAEQGFLVLSEIWYRGWEAWIDGRRVPVERANYALRGLPVPAGEHRVEFVFRAHSFRNGAAYTLLGVILLLIGAGSTRFGSGRFLDRFESLLRALATRNYSAIESFWKKYWRILTGLKARLLLILPWFIGVAALAGLLIYGGNLMKYGSYAVGGSDSSGYANIAQSLLNGHLVQPVVEIEKFGLSDAFIHDFIPLGYIPGPRARTMAPTYPVGLPLHMALGAWLAGWNYGPFLVNPILGALSLILIYLVGLELGLSRAYSIAGAVILAANPTYNVMALSPMSDVTATFWALIAIWASLCSRRHERWALLAGAAFGMGVLIRPSNILILIPLLFSLRLTYRTLLFFLLGGLPTAVILFAFNVTAYGHPFSTGYAMIGCMDLMNMTGFGTRFNHYIYWLSMTLSPLPLLGWVGVALNRKVIWRDRAVLIAWFGAFLIFYAFYDIYGDWEYTRFLLPAYPAMILGALLTAREIVGFGNKIFRIRLASAVSIILLVIVLAYERNITKTYNVFIAGEVASVNSASCRWADQLLPKQALVVSMEMSGAVKYYTQRSTVRWDYLTPDQWVLLKKNALEKSYKMYALLLPQEVEDAQKRLPGKWMQMGSYYHISLWQIEKDA